MTLFLFGAMPLNALASHAPPFARSRVIRQRGAVVHVGHTPAHAGQMNGRVRP